jgi:putative nucleotidyltransferase with HDIG domain
MALASGKEVKVERDYSELYAELKLGDSMPCHAFSFDGLLLLAREECIISQEQLERLSYPDVLFTDQPPDAHMLEVLKRKKAAATVKHWLESLDNNPEAPGPAVPVTSALPPAAPAAVTACVPFREELKSAVTLQQAAIQQIAGFFQQIQSGDKVDLSVAKDTVGQILGSLDRNERVFSSLARLKSFDNYTFNHSLNTCVLSLLIARHCGLVEDISSLGLGALMHDIGKTLIPVELIHKEGRLTEEEWHSMAQHPSLGLEIIEQSSIGEHCAREAVGQHHERINGSGYPLQLPEAKILLAGRIATIADVYDAMTSRRPYREAISPPETIRWIKDQSGVLFDPRLVQSFMAAVGIFPVGSLALLTNGEYGIVLSVNRQELLRPLVLVITENGQVGDRRPRLLNLAHPERKEDAADIAGLVEPDTLGLAIAEIDEYLAQVSEEQIHAKEAPPAPVSTSPLQHKKLDLRA